MADDRYNWLDKDAAEQLLRGEPVSARHGDGARELEQLLKAAAAACADMPGTAELPGEEAAVAAFRRARHGAGVGARHRATGEPLPAVHAAPTTGIAERTRLARPFRRGFAVALAACAIGGVAVAAGTGVLPTPFRGDPAPASSVSAAETPGPLDTREPGAQTDGTTGRTPDSTPGSRARDPAAPRHPAAAPAPPERPARASPAAAPDTAVAPATEAPTPVAATRRSFCSPCAGPTNPANGTRWTATRCGASKARPAARRRCMPSAAPTSPATRSVAARVTTMASAAASAAPIRAAAARAAPRAATRTTTNTPPSRPAAPRPRHLDPGPRAVGDRHGPRECHSRRNCHQHGVTFFEPVTQY